MTQMSLMALFNVGKVRRGSHVFTELDMAGLVSRYMVLDSKQQKHKMCMITQAGRDALVNNVVPASEFRRLLYTNVTTTEADDVANVEAHKAAMHAAQSALEADQAKQMPLKARPLADVVRGYIDEHRRIVSRWTNHTESEYAAMQLRHLLEAVA